MSAVIFSFRDSNMAGQEWRWSFGLHRSPEGAFTLMALQEFDDPADFGDELPIAPGIGLRNGVEIYERFAAQIEEAGIAIDGIGLTAVANRIAHIDPQAAKDFKRGPKALRDRASRQKARTAHLRAVQLVPFLDAIEAYCAQLSDAQYRGGGGISRLSERARVRAFMEQYAIAHQRLPTGPHKWEMANGFLSGEHDFGPTGAR